MEKKDWRTRIGTVLNDNRIDILDKDGSSLLDDLEKLIEQELDKAREEVLIELRDELLEQIEMGMKHNIYGGVADYQDALHFVGNKLSKLKE